MINPYESPKTLDEAEPERLLVWPKVDAPRLCKFSLICIGLQAVWVFVPLVIGDKFPGGILALTIIGLSMMLLFVSGFAAAVLAALFGKATTRYIAIGVSAFYVFVIMVWRGLIW